MPRELTQSKRLTLQTSAPNKTIPVKGNYSVIRHLHIVPDILRKRPAGIPAYLLGCVSSERKWLCWRLMVFAFYSRVLFEPTTMNGAGRRCPGSKVSLPTLIHLCLCYHIFQYVFIYLCIYGDRLSVGRPGCPGTQLTRPASHLWWSPSPPKCWNFGCGPPCPNFPTSVCFLSSPHHIPSWYAGSSLLGAHSCLIFWHHISLKNSPWELFLISIGDLSNQTPRGYGNELKVCPGEDGGGMCVCVWRGKLIPRLNF